VSLLRGTHRVFKQNILLSSVIGLNMLQSCTTKSPLKYVLNWTSMEREKNRTCRMNWNLKQLYSKYSLSDGYIKFTYYSIYPIPVASQSKAWVCGRSLAGIAGSNPAEGHGYLSVAIFVCCQVQVSVTGWSLVQRSPTECGVSEYDLENSTRKRPRLTRVVDPS
jgi:hypothetical protein